MKFTADNGSANLITGTFLARAPDQQVNVLTLSTTEPVANIPKFGPEVGSAGEPLQVNLTRSSACLTVTLPPAHTGIVVVKDFAGNILFTTETPK